MGNAEGPAVLGLKDGFEELGRQVGALVGSVVGAKGSIVGGEGGARVGT